ncbi:hypothetical protein NLM27_16460 [Bradyrhizobium sp. CCGB12]|uniref:hypothetical protein n=1 Tax=Bradyrhizobium sp. CCGB12 TaxID=2949632 RepID=UPI0020B18891|nr:hypothetical protein [Bradyrhizobium sp. CCGB12]MCP3390373.1 hypothetical protein [Bradyrhizobium sp. CCGB12]
MVAGVVSLSGTSTQNQTLAANITDVDGIPVGAPIAYQWQQSADNGVSWTDIAGATASSLTLQQAYVGTLVRAGVSYADAAGNAEQDFSPATASVGNVNDVGVASIVGTTVQGQTLTASVTDLDGLANVAISYRWQQLTNGSWSNISQATGVTYTLQAAQVGRQVRVRVTYTDQLGGSESNRTSAATPVIVATNPAGNDIGVVSLSGTSTQNQVLVANVTDVDGLPSGTSIGYQWQQSSDGGVTWSDIAAGATGKALTLTQAQVAMRVRAVVSYTDAAGSAQSVASAATTAIANVNDAGVVATTGAPVQGQILKADVTDRDGLTNVSITYRWQQLINGTWSNIANATGATLTLQPAQVGRQVRVLVSYTDQLGGGGNQPDERSHPAGRDRQQSPRRGECQRDTDAEPGVDGDRERCGRSAGHHHLSVAAERERQYLDQHQRRDGEHVDPWAGPRRQLRACHRHVYGPPGQQRDSIEPRDRHGGDQRQRRWCRRDQRHGDPEPDSDG